MLSFTVSERKLQSSLSIERYIHTMGVVKAADRLAENYGYDRAKARMAALMHDCAKDYPADMKRRFCREFHVDVDEIMLETIDLTHAFLGAEVARREFGVEDEEILGAIKYHTTGKADMSMLEKIVFIADYIEENRKKFDSLDEARKIAFEDIDKAMAYVLKHTIEFVKERGRTLHPLSVEAYEYYKQFEEEK